LGAIHYEGEKAMDHDVVVREKMTEKYLLEELGAELRDEFEEHFFECSECALDVRLGSELVEQSKVLLKDNSEPRPVVRPIPPPRGWFAWLRPEFAVPAMAVLLVVIGFQTVTLRQLSQKASQPQFLPAVSLNLQTYGSNTAPLVMHQGQGFLLNVIVPPGHHFPAYRVDLSNPAGTIEASIPVKDSADDTWPIGFPEANRQSGTYKLAVHGITASGQDVEVGSSSFEVRIEK
jgi:hypothetical protein